MIFSPLVITNFNQMLPFEFINYLQIMFIAIIITAIIINFIIIKAIQTYIPLKP